jgi:hypothetical protein
MLSLPKRILKRILNGPRDDVDIYMEKFMKKFDLSSFETEDIIDKFENHPRMKKMEEVPVGEDPDEYDLF